MAFTVEQAQAKAEEIVSGVAVTPAEALALERVLRNARRFGWARKVLARAATHDSLLSDMPLRRQLAQKQALCTYKDPDLPTDQKLEDALQILQRVDDLASSTDQETLGLAGAIFKRKWELMAQERLLEVSLGYYFRGYRQGVARDFGYTAINAAYVLDALADQETVDGHHAELVAHAAQRRDLARRIRTEICAALPALAESPDGQWLGTTWWFLVTLGEAHFGLRDPASARTWLMRAAALPDVPDWEKEATARQIAGLLRVMDNADRRAGRPTDAAAERVLGDFLGSNLAAKESVLRGKVGLALSGGGFRASFYHVGVLARLAEVDLLRHVEFLSCVSGGSIIGAHFYLEVKALLTRKADADITRQDYIDIVQRIEKDFFAGVASNIRTRIAAELLTNLKMMFLPWYSRTMRAGELYEREIFSRVPDGHGKAPRFMDDLKIVPLGEDDFSPKDHNWRRSAKVPILVLNATSLNTGHNWQFTATWMGEPPAGINSEVDANFRLRRMYYSEAPEPHRRVRLGHAVAASACVPGLFEPLTLAGLYERTPTDGDRKLRPVVRLVDGGVHDNQGVASLLEQGCSVLLVSDASGQMDDSDVPSNGLLGVPLRANSILQSRVRASQFEDLASRRRGGLLRGLMFVHLKKDLETQTVDWLQCKQPSTPPANDPLLPYGVHRLVQRKLAAIRTDLDSFSEVEASALMASGYLMTKHALDGPVLGHPVQQQMRKSWGFLAVESLLKDATPGTPLWRQLGVANQLFFKVWKLIRQLRWLGWVLALALLGLLVYLVWQGWDHEIGRLRVGSVAAFVFFGVLPLLGLGFVGKVVRYRKTGTDVLIGAGTALFGFLLARLHLHVFDKLFLWQGRVSRLR